MLSRQVDPTVRAEREVRGLFADEGALERGVAWARAVLEEAELDASMQQLRALRALRRADRRLSLVAARYLVDRVGGSPAPRARDRSPLLD